MFGEATVLYINKLPEFLFKKEKGKLELQGKGVGKELKKEY